MIDRGHLVSLFPVHWWGVFLDVDSFTFLLVLCGSLVSTLLLSIDTEGPAALRWSPTPVDFQILSKAS